jgi:hypothetical protein
MTAPETFTTDSKRPLTTGRCPEETISAVEAAAREVAAVYKEGK